MKSWVNYLNKHNGSVTKAAAAFVRDMPQSLGAIVDALNPRAKLDEPVLRRKMVRKALSLVRNFDEGMYALSILNDFPEVTRDIRAKFLHRLITMVDTKTKSKKMRAEMVPKYLSSAESWAKELRMLAGQKEREFLTDFADTFEALQNPNLSPAEIRTLLDLAAERQMSSLEDGERLLRFLPAGANDQTIANRMLNEFATSREDYMRIWRNAFVSQGYRNLAIVKAASMCITNKDREEVLCDQGCLAPMSWPNEDHLFTSDELHLPLLNCAKDLMADCDNLNECWRLFGPLSDLVARNNVPGVKRNRPHAGQRALAEAAVLRTLQLTWNDVRLAGTGLTTTMAAICADMIDRTRRPQLSQCWIDLWTRVIECIESLDELEDCADYLEGRGILSANNGVLIRVIESKKKKLS